MRDLLRVARDLQDYFEENGWPFCFIGGLAVQNWGQPRLTQDVDACLFSGVGEEETFIDSNRSRTRGNRRLVVLIVAIVVFRMDKTIKVLPYM